MIAFIGDFNETDDYYNFNLILYYLKINQTKNSIKKDFILTLNLKKLILKCLKMRFYSEYILRQTKKKSQKNNYTFLFFKLEKIISFWKF